MQSHHCSLIPRQRLARTVGKIRDCPGEGISDTGRRLCVHIDLSVTANSLICTGAMDPRSEIWLATRQKGILQHHLPRQ